LICCYGERDNGLRGTRLYALTRNYVVETEELFCEVPTLCLRHIIQATRECEARAAIIKTACYRRVSVHLTDRQTEQRSMFKYMCVKSLPHDVTLILIVIQVLMRPLHTYQ